MDVTFGWRRHYGLAGGKIEPVPFLKVIEFGPTSPHEFAFMGPSTTAITARMRTMNIEVRILGGGGKVAINNRALKKDSLVKPYQDAALSLLTGGVSMVMVGLKQLDKLSSLWAPRLITLKPGEDGEWVVKVPYPLARIGSLIDVSRAAGGHQYDDIVNQMARHR
jgi:hypothetical protein